MGWLIFAIAAWSTAILLIPLSEWKKIWYAGILAIPIVFITDNILADLGAFKFADAKLYLLNLPALYLISFFPGGLIYRHYLPRNIKYRLLYICTSAFALLTFELILKYFGYFQYLHWNAFYSFLLNFFGFTVQLWPSDWIKDTFISLNDRIAK